MSVDKNEYIGPYLKIKIPTETVVEDKDPKCCGHIRTGKHCANCGAKLVPEKISVTRDAVSQYDISSEIREELNHLHDMAGQGRDGFDYWKPNGTPGAWKLPDHDRVGAQEVTPELIVVTVEKFKKRYKKEIEHLEQSYNNRSEVKFGLLMWYS